ncbi:GntR family transcriptional regulator [Sphingomonas sp. R647]|uniref:GntR family transcriptional regulator n=1 Tax=Sphingomonas sp. R647 TaxID=2875233 RepID=UPI001CD5558E|nr:GntR family transcriptional regulator [Sphingomonas sp. R647]MCA1196501.1 GntR family transcriptional regulator [Sphingomonas sp. R647]
MSPLQAMERSYAALKTILREGRLAPGHRLEAVRLADEIGVSMTPVRDALNRLVGEQLVEASAGDGFHVPRYSEAELRNLYEWHAALVTLAIRTARTLPDPDDLAVVLATRSHAEAAAMGFELLANTTANRELRTAILNAGDRLHAFRRLEHIALPLPAAEIAAAITPGPDQRAAIRRYHVARMRAAPKLLEARTNRK